MLRGCSQETWSWRCYLNPKQDTAIHYHYLALYNLMYLARKLILTAASCQLAAQTCTLGLRFWARRSFLTSLWGHAVHPMEAMYPIPAWLFLGKWSRDVSWGAHDAETRRFRETSHVLHKQKRQASLTSVGGCGSSPETTA